MNRRLLLVLIPVIGAFAIAVVQYVVPLFLQPRQVPHKAMLKSATATFLTTDHGKQRTTGVILSLVKWTADGQPHDVGSVELTGVAFQQNSKSGPHALELKPSSDLSSQDLNACVVQVQILPDALRNESWTFDLQLSLKFTDGPAQTRWLRDQKLTSSHKSMTSPLLQ
jgi:hypothetical protein